MSRPDPWHSLLQQPITPYNNAPHTNPSYCLEDDDHLCKLRLSKTIPAGCSAEVPATAKGDLNNVLKETSRHSSVSQWIRKNQKRCWRSSPPACTASLIFEVQKPRDLDLGSGQGHINIHSTCRPTSVPNNVTVVTRSIEIWPFQFHEIWTFGEVWTLVIAFLKGNSRIGLRQDVAQVPYYHHQPSVLSSTRKWRRR